MHDGPAITLTNASYTVQGRSVLSGLHFTLTERRIGIVGRNGSGKTTLLRLMAGLIAPSGGTVTVNGIDPAKNRKAVLAQLGILFQNPDHQILFPTVEEELAFGLRQQGVSPKAAALRVEHALAVEGRSHWARASTHSLSQGQRHYLCLLSVLLMAPNTILLDEPLAGLDLPTQIRLTRRFASLSQQLITITHDPTAVAQCDRILWIEAGQIKADGPAAPVLAAFSAEMQAEGARDADIDLQP
jgi:biotin transport system ATP-binding protein